MPGVMEHRESQAVVANKITIFKNIWLKIVLPNGS